MRKPIDETDNGTLIRSRQSSWMHDSLMPFICKFVKLGNKREKEEE
jgi:hypothetical protein